MQKYVIALYIRLSMDDTKTESLSIESQQMLLNSFANELDTDSEIETVEFIDNGFSGTNFERPEVQRLIDMIRNGEVNCVLVKDFSRFGRDSIETRYFIEKVFPLFDVRFISITDGFDSKENNNSGTDIAFKFLINEYYSYDLSKKVKSSIYNRMEHGTYLAGNAVYGYKKVNNKLEIDNEAAEIVSLVFALACEGLSNLQIAQKLNEKKVLRPSQYKAAKGLKCGNKFISLKLWQSDTVARILRDEKYTGMYIGGKTTVKAVGAISSRLREESEWIKISNHHPAIVASKIFEIANGNGRRNHFKTRKKGIKHPLSKKVFCGCCNHSLERKNIDPVYICRYSSVSSDLDCYGLKVREKDIEEMLFEIIKKQVDVIVNLKNLDFKGLLSNNNITKSETDSQISEYQNDKIKLYENFVIGVVGENAYNEQKSSIDSKLARLNDISLSSATKTKSINSEKEMFENLQKIATLFLGEKTLTCELMDMLIDKIFVYQNNDIRVNWKIQDFTSELTKVEGDVYAITNNF